MVNMIPDGLYKENLVIHKTFWSEEARWSLFRLRCIRILTDGHGSKRPLRKWIQDELSLSGLNISDFGLSESQIYRFLDPAVNHKSVFSRSPELKTLLLVVMHRRQNQASKETIKKHQDEYREIAKLYELLPPDIHDSAANIFETAAQDSPTAFAALELLLQFLGVEKQLNQKFVDQFFNRNDQDRALAGAAVERHYRYWRYSTSAGVFMNSFVVLHAPNKLLPLMRFSKFHESKSGALISTRGIIVPYAQEAYFLGNYSSGGGIFVFSFPRLLENNTYIQGLTLDYAPKSAALAARSILKKLDRVVHHEQINTGLLTSSDAKQHLNPNDISFLRNEIPFVLERSVFRKGRQRPLSERNIVDYIDTLIQDKEGYTLTYDTPEGEGEPFNPALHDDYTFNSALTLFK